MSQVVGVLRCSQVFQHFSDVEGLFAAIEECGLPRPRVELLLQVAPASLSVVAQIFMIQKATMIRGSSFMGSSLSLATMRH